MKTHEERLSAALETLDALSVGDAVGESLSYRFYEARLNADFSMFRDDTLRFTDDTEMALALIESLKISQTMTEDIVAWSFSSRYKRDPDRGYGRMARRILEEIGMGVPWEEVSSKAFGFGSFGNGAAMRVAPVGVYFSDDMNTVTEMATRSARVTHYHPEGIAGAVAVAVAAAAAYQARSLPIKEAVGNIWGAVIEYTPGSTVKEKLSRAREMNKISALEASRALGNGAEISAQDTVPFCL